MLDMRMDSAIAEQAHQMQLVAAPAFHRLPQQWLFEKIPTRDQLVDARDVHQHDASRANIQMAHFAVAHLPVGQTRRTAQTCV